MIDGIVGPIVIVAPGGSMLSLLAAFPVGNNGRIGSGSRRCIVVLHCLIPIVVEIWKRQRRVMKLTLPPLARFGTGSLGGQCGSSEFRMTDHTRR